jgi:multicomponent Na+:H+ antiporter subunit D
MAIGTISNIYLIIFLPLISALFCQLFQFKNSSFIISILNYIILFILILKIFPDILIFEKIKNDFELSKLSIGLEFSLDIIGIFFIIILVLIEFLVLLFYRENIKSLLNSKNQTNLYAVLLVNLFSLIGIITTNNLFNLYLFIEIHSFALFSLATISYNYKLLKITFKSYCLNIISSILILISFFALYLAFGEVNFDKIVANTYLLPANKLWFLMGILFLLSIAFITKFFPVWQFFENIKTSNVIGNFLIIDAFFIRIIIGFYLCLKFIHFFFGNSFLFSSFELSKIMIIVGFIIIIYSSLKVVRYNNLKIICVFFSLSNIGFIIASIGIHSIESMQSLFFQLINFSLVNFFIFLLASYLKNNLNSDSFGNAYNKLISNNFLILPLKLMIIFISSFPFTLLFFSNWYLLISVIEYDLKIIILIAIFIAGYSQLIICTRIYAQMKFTENSNKFITKQTGQNYIQIFVLWIMVAIILSLLILSSALNNLSLKFALFLISNTI